MNLNNIYDIFVKNENSSFGKKKKEISYEWKIINSNNSLI